MNNGVERVFRSGVCTNGNNGGAMNVRAAYSCLIMVLTVLLFCGGSRPGNAWASDVKLQPSLTVAEEYNDNIYLSSRDRRSDYITSATPGISLKFNDPVLFADLFGSYTRRIYANNTRQNDNPFYFKGTTRLTVLKERLFLEVSDVYQKVSRDITRDYTQESSFYNQTDSNVFTVHPYWVLRPSTMLTITTGYKFIDTWYKDPGSIDKRDHVGYVKAEYEAMANLLLTAQYTATREEANSYDFWRHELLAGPKYTYAKDSFIFLMLGNTWVDYDDGRAHSGLAFSGGLTHAFDTLIVSLTAQQTFADNPDSSPSKVNTFALNLQKTLPRTVLTAGVYLNQYYQTANDQLDTRTYGARMGVKYELTERMKAGCDLTYEKLERRLWVNSNTKRFLVSLPLTYALTDKISASATYSYTNLSTPETPYDNYHNNRFILSATANF